LETTIFDVSLYDFHFFSLVADFIITALIIRPQCVRVQRK